MKFYVMKQYALLGFRGTILMIIIVIIIRIRVGMVMRIRIT